MYQVYKIMDDDSLDLLAERFSTTVDELERINGKFNFDVGNLMVVPNSSDLYYRYVVKSGDTLYGISKMYNQNVDVLYEINGIKEGDYIYPGEEIMIPKNNVSAYIVKQNDTIEDVANKMMTSVEDILKENKKIYLMPEQLIIYKEG